MIISIVGPTGVGKTKLSVMLAKRYNAVIINGDACQIYNKLNIGTAKVKEEEKEGVEHLLFDIREPNQEYSVSDYQKDLRNLLEKYKNQNVIIVGGTGLYITAGLYDYDFSKMNEIDYSGYSNEELLKLCKEKDKNCDIHVNNRIRLENFLKREEPVGKDAKLLYDVKFIGLTTDRENLYNRINERVEEMVNEGLVEEVKALKDEYGETNILKRAIGYKEVIEYLNGEISLEESISLIQKNSRHYAKRQYTWFKNKMDINWFNTDFNNFNNTYENVIKFIEQWVIIVFLWKKLLVCTSN